MKKSKVLVMILCAVLLVATTVLGTMAYFTDRESVTNTFTVGKVAITLDEAKVEPDGTPVTPAERTQDGNKYHLVPGQTYTKDPTMTVVKDSEESYVRMLVTINCAKEFDAIYAPAQADLTKIFNEYDGAVWLYEGETEDAANNTITYEFRYHETVKKADTDTPLNPLFTSITVPSTFDGDDMESIKDLKITVVGHAIQAATFDDADAAWAAFDGQNNP